MFALVDCNNFYVSCERVFSPGLNGKPVVVLSNNDGIIIARSNEAKKLGIKMGEAAFKIGDFLQKNQVAVFSSNYALYGDMSQRVMNTLAQFTPEIEIYSIDEAFLNLAGISTNLAEYAGQIKKTVFKNTGIPVSVGIGPTKVLAKIANHYAKKVLENKNLFILDAPDKITGALKQLEIGEVWGIGRQYALLLNGNNIKTAWDFRQMPDEWVRKKMTVTGLRIKKELEGFSCLAMELIPPLKKAICTSRSFGEAQAGLEPLREAVAFFANKCAYKLRKQKSCANIMMVFLDTGRFSQDGPCYNQNYVCKLPAATNNSMEMIRHALTALQSIYQTGYRYRKAGVIVTGIAPENQAQGSLFAQFDQNGAIRHSILMKTMDQINLKYGSNTIKVAALGDDDAKWKLRREKLSPCYTTRWEDIIILHV